MHGATKFNWDALQLTRWCCAESVKLAGCSARVIFIAHCLRSAPQRAKKSTARTHNLRSSEKKLCGEFTAAARNAIREPQCATTSARIGPKRCRQTASRHKTLPEDEQLVREQKIKCYWIESSFEGGAREHSYLFISGFLHNSSKLEYVLQGF